ncbi:MAG: hypothetical protein LBO03_04345 [Acidaminococcales bacterium]|nr:hypothetical protein [Acidaminococcales bacterium]
MSVLCLAKSIELLAQAEVAIFMPGWEGARGCRIERAVCRDYGIAIEHWPPNETGAD